MRRARFACAGAVVVAAMAGATWLLGFRAWKLYHYVDYLGGTGQHWDIRTGEQPWWTAYAAVGVLVIGAAVAVLVLPEARDRIRRFVATRVADLF